METIDTSTPEYRKTYRYWRIRIMYTTMIGYAVFYFVRKNMSLALRAWKPNWELPKPSWVFS